MTAGDADVLVQRRVTVDGGFLRRHHAVAQRIQAAHRHRQLLAFAQLLGARLHGVGVGAHGVGNQPVQRLHERRRLAAFGVHAHRAAQGDDATHALRRLMRAVEGEHATQAPADQAHPAPALVMQPADLLLQGLRMPALEAHVAAEAPGLHVVAAAAQEEFQREQRDLVGHEAGQQQHRVAVAARRQHQSRHRIRQESHLEQRPPLGQRVQQMRFPLVRMARIHGLLR